MKRFVLGSVALAAMVAGPAMAADMPVKAPAPVVSYYDWTGVYIGASIGWARPEVTREYPGAAVALVPGPTIGFVPAGSSTSSSNETIYDVHAGAQVQWGWLILGAEAGYSAGFEYMIYKGVLVDAILGAEYQHVDVSSKTAFADLGANTFTQKAKVDMARARLTIKTHAWSFLQ